MGNEHLCSTLLSPHQSAVANLSSSVVRSSPVPLRSIIDPISALGLAASIIAVIQLSKSVLKNVGPSAYNKADLNRLLGLVSGFKGAYESLEYRLEYSEDNESRAKLLRQLEEPAKECKLVLECLRERLENINFVRQYIVGNRLDKKFKACMDRLKDQKELFELLMQADQQ